MGIEITCSKCKGTGNMGFVTSICCNVCSGKGNIQITTMYSEALHEWLEGYFDKDTDDAWLERQLKKLIEERKNRFGE
jgi:RecJ-like exonuclease